jgi:hypothetical protein
MIVPSYPKRVWLDGFYCCHIAGFGAEFKISAAAFGARIAWDLLMRNSAA